MRKKGYKLSEEVKARIRAGRLAKGPTTEQRFFAKVRKTDTCWIWTGSVWHGYGNFFFNRKVCQAHRVSWVLAGKKLPEKPLVLDHMCRNQVCVNPAHLRVVTPRINAIENNASPLAKNAQKTHCSHGHEFTPQNTTYFTPRYTVGPRGERKPGRPTRRCMTCYESKRKGLKPECHSQCHSQEKP